jgi:hypothetical protein
MPTIVDVSPEEAMTQPTATDKPRKASNPMLGVLPFIGVILFLCHIGYGLLTGATSDWPRGLVQYGVYYLIGWAAIGGGISHVFFGRKISASIGWDPSPFETEVGFANLGFGVAGVLALNYSSDFWWAVILANSVFRVLAGVGHIRSMVRDKDYSVNNTGILFLDFLVPAFLVVGYLSWV